MVLSDYEELDIRRLADNQKKRKLTPEEIARLAYYRAIYSMGWKDQKGYDFEIKTVLPALIEAGFEQHISHHNPIHPFDWSRTKQIGVDLILEVGKHTLYVEQTCLSKINYRVSWFIDSRLPRFKGYPKPNEYVHWILLTNRPENFGEKVRKIAEEYSITILSIDELLQLLKTLTITKPIQTVIT